MVFQLRIEKAFLGIFPRLFRRIAFEHLTADVLADGSFARSSIKSA
jgi:hypothetical protein